MTHFRCRLILCLGLLLFTACSRQDPMDMTIKASTLEEYAESVLRIRAAIRDDRDRARFVEALEEVALGPEDLLALHMGAGIVAGLPKAANVKRILEKCDGKSVREVVRMAETEIEEKEQIRLRRLRDVRAPFSSETHDVIIDGDRMLLFPRPVRPSDAELTRRAIVGALRDIETYRMHWVNTTGRRRGQNANPAVDEIRDTYDWPSSTGRLQGAEFFYMDDGRGACRYEGKVYTLGSPELSDEGRFP